MSATSDLTHIIGTLTPGTYTAEFLARRITNSGYTHPDHWPTDWPTDTDPADLIPELTYNEIARHVLTHFADELDTHSGESMLAADHVRHWRDTHYPAN